MAAPLPRALMTAEEFALLPEDNSARYELQVGVLLVSPCPNRRHQRCAYRLAKQVERQLPGGWEVLLDVEVVVEPNEPATLRVPDLVVTRTSGPPDRLSAADVALAVEVLSPGTRNVDLHLKPFEYAEAGIPHYWAVDLDPPSLMVFGLGAFGEGYVEQPAVTGEATVEIDLDGPRALRLDLACLEEC